MTPCMNGGETSAHAGHAKSVGVRWQATTDRWQVGYCSHGFRTCDHADRTHALTTKFAVHVLLNHLLQSMLNWWPGSLYYKNEWRQEKVSAILCAVLLIFSPISHEQCCSSSVFCLPFLSHIPGCSGLRVAWRSISSDSLFSEWQYLVRWHMHIKLQVEFKCL